MSSHEELPIRIAGIGLSSQIQQRLEQIFREYARSQYTMVEEALAEAGIVDLDGFTGGELWRHYRSHHPTLPTIVLSLQPRRLEYTLFVQKPVETSALLAALEQLGKQVKADRQAAAPLASLLEHAGKTPGPVLAPPAGAQPGEIDAQTEAYYEPGHLEDSLCIQEKQLKDFNPARAEDLVRVYYEPGEYLQGMLQQSARLAEQERTPLKLELPNGTLLLDPARNRIFYSGREEYWRSLAVQPLAQHLMRSERLSEQAIGQYLRGTAEPMRWQYLDRFLWKIALWSAHGRVPNGSNLHTPIVLLYWPNFTRLLLTPHAVQIAALWRKQPYSLLETGKLLGIRYCYVFGFFSAAHALGMAFPERRSARLAEGSDLAAIVHQAETPSEKRGLFQRILAHLRRG
jgi:hypothetical protein